ncbi:hypothetical protein CHS0354_010003 [Potamilus streckersoni]|uniref:Uncharacterized protein n=1 Tax=Potamilus streckersoni TaxID=2493646 RepID=A0AAE0SD78_9BIVA|nr:hypothetical protein CHS0354_010003 [Potamilus streckersoni]
MRRSYDTERGFDAQEAILKANARTKKWIAYSVVVGSFALFAIAGILIGLYLTGNLRQVLPDQDDSINARTHGDALTGDFAQNQFGSKKLDGSVDPLAGGVPVKLPTTLNPVLLLAAKESDVVDKVADAVSDTADIVKDAAGDAVDIVKDAVGDIVDSVGDVASDVADNVGDAIDTVKDGLEEIVDAHKDVVEDSLGDAADLVKDSVDNIADKTDDVLDDVLSGVDMDDIGDDMGDNVGLRVKDIGDEIKDIFDDVLDDEDSESDEIIEEAGDKLKDTLKIISKVGENIKEGLDDAGENIKDGVKGVLDGVDDIVDDSREDGIFEGIKTVIKGVGDSFGEVVDKTKDLIKNIGENVAPSKILDDGTDDLRDGLGDDLEVGEFDDNSGILHDVLHDAVDDVDDNNDDTGEVNVKTVGHGNPGELHAAIKGGVDNVGDNDIHFNSNRTNSDIDDDDDSDEEEDDSKATIVVGNIEDISKSIRGALEVSVDRDDGSNNDGIADVLDDVLDDRRANDDGSPVMHVSSEKLGVRVLGTEVHIDAANDDQRDDNTGRGHISDDDDDIDDNINRNITDFIQADTNNEAIRRSNNNDDDSDDNNDDDDDHNSNTTNNSHNSESQNDASDDGVIFGPSPAGILLGRSDNQHESPLSSVVHLNTGTFITVSRSRPAPVRSDRVFRVTVSRNSPLQPVLVGSSNNNGDRFTLQSIPQSSVVFNNDDDDNDDDGRSLNISPVVSSHRINSAATFRTSHQSVHPNFQPVISQLFGHFGQPNTLLSVRSTDPISPFTSVSSLPSPWSDQSDSNN